MLRRILALGLLGLLLTACAPKAAPPAPPPVQTAEPAPPAPPQSQPEPQAPPAPERAVPEVLARPVSEGGPRRIALKDGETVSQAGAYFLSTATGKGEGWVYPAEPWWGTTITDDNRFVIAAGDKTGYLIDREQQAVWQWERESVQLLLAGARGHLFAEMERRDLNLRQTGRYFWAGPDFKPRWTFAMEGEPGWVSRALLSPDGSRLALLGERSLALLDLQNGTLQTVGLPTANWIGAGHMVSVADGFEVHLLADSPRWRTVVAAFSWNGTPLAGKEIPGRHLVTSPDGTWLAWEEWAGDLAPVTVVADARSLKPRLYAAGASPCYQSMSSTGSRWLADSSALLLATPDSNYWRLALDGALTALPGLEGPDWKAEPIPAPDKPNRYSVGRTTVVEGAKRLSVGLSTNLFPAMISPWGATSGELRFALPAKPGGGACSETPAMPVAVYREALPAFLLRVESARCLPLTQEINGREATCLPPGTRLNPVRERSDRRGAEWIMGQWWIFVQTESGQSGWVSLKDQPLGWAR